MQIRLYTLNPIDPSERSSFELPAWPRSSNPAAIAVFKEFMEKYKVIWYLDSSDESEKLGPITNYPKVPLDESFGCFYHKGIVDDETLIIKQVPETMLDEKTFSKSRAIYGDNAAWLEFNTIGAMTLVSSDLHKFEVATQYMNCADNQCKKDKNEGRKFKI